MSLRGCSRDKNRFGREHTDALHSLIDRSQVGCNSVSRSQCGDPDAAVLPDCYGIMKFGQRFVRHDMQVPLRLTIATVMLDIGTEWTLNASLTRFSSYRRCSKHRILGHSAQVTFWLRIGGTMKSKPAVRGFGCGSAMASVAEPSPLQHPDYRERGTKLPANGREKWRRRKLLVSCRNSQRLNKTYFRTSRTATSLKLIRSAAIQFCAV
jgi:hypothetical protein